MAKSVRSRFRKYPARWIEVGRGPRRIRWHSTLRLCPPKMAEVDVCDHDPAVPQFWLNGRPVGRAPIQRSVGSRSGCAIWSSCAMATATKNGRGSITPRFGAERMTLQSELDTTCRRPKPPPPPPPEPKAAEPSISDVVVALDRAGSAQRGRGLLNDKCNLCHGEDVAKIDYHRYTQDGWSRYFAYGRHTRKASLKGIVSARELADIKAFLLANAADVDSDVAAGVR